MKTKILLVILFFIAYSILINESCQSQWVGKFHNFGDNKSVYALAAYNGYLFAATNVGVHYTSDNGDDWSSELTYQTIEGNIWCMVLVGGNFYAGVQDSGVYVSTDGFAWTRTSLGNEDVYSIAVNGTTVYAGTWGHGVFKSLNNGLTWTQSGLSTMHITALAISGNYIFAGTNENLSPKGIYISTNGGASWAQSSLNNKVVTSFAILGNNIFAATHNANPSGVYVSTNNGGTWTITALNNKVLNTVYAYDNKLFAGAYNGGIYYSSNNGTTWKDKNEGFPQSSLPSVHCFQVAYNYIFEGNYGWSVWSRVYAETIGVIKLSSEVPAAYSLLQNYPNPFNSSTSINFAIPKDVIVSMTVFDVSGKTVEKIVNNEFVNAGFYKAEFNGTNLSSGIYFYRIETKDFVESKKIILMK